MVKFLKPEFLHLFWIFLLPVLIVLFFGLKSRFKIRKVWEQSKLRNISRFSSKRRAIVISCLMVLMLSFIIFALARTQIFYQKSVKKPLDIVCLVDLSRSKNTRDVFLLGKKVSRLELTKEELRNFVKNQIGRDKNQLALIVFGNTANYRSYFTRDVGSLLFHIDYLDTKDFPPEGTDIGRAIIHGLEMLDLIDKHPEIFKRPKNKRVFVLISDGEDTEGGVGQALEKVRNRRIPIYTIGVGSKEGGPVIEEIDKDGKIIYMIDENSGEKIYSKLEERILKEIARATNGRYAHSKTGEELSKALENILEREAERKMEKAHHDIYPYLLLAAFVLCLVIIILEQN